MMGIDEQKALVKGLKNGSEDAFKQFVLVFSTKIKAMANNILKDDDVAQDIAQNVYFTIFRKIALFRGDSKLSSWVYRIAVNEIFAYHRKKRKNTFEELNDNMGSATRHNCPESALLYIEFNKLLRKSIQKLSWKEMIVFVYHDVEDMSTHEICRELKSDPPAIKSRLLRGRKKLRKSCIGRYLNP